MMKRFVTILTAAALILSNTAYAALTDSKTVDINITVDKDVSIVLTGGPISFIGNLKAGEATVSANYVAVENNGSGMDEDIAFGITDPTGWARGADSGDETYAIWFLFNNSETAPAVDDTNWKTKEEFDTAPETFTYGAPKNLWVKLKPPKPTKIYTAQTIGISINAAE